MENNNLNQNNNDEANNNENDESQNDAMQEEPNEEGQQETEERNEILNDDQEEESNNSEDSENSDDSNSEMIITLGDDDESQEEEKRAPDWIREVRKQNREYKKRIRELENQIEPKKEELPTKPTLEECDYDSDEYERKLDVYYQQKQKHDAKELEIKQQQENEQKSWNEKLQNYENSKKTLKVNDFEDSEEVVMELFSPEQQAMIIDAADNPSTLIYAIGKNRNVAQKLASIKNGVKFAREIGRLEDTKLKTITRKPPKPESRVNGTTGGGAGDNALEKLRQEAEKTGNYTKVMAYKRKMRSQK